MAFAFSCKKHYFCPSCHQKRGFLYRNAVKDFAPISFVAPVPHVLVVDPSLPVKTVQEFIALVKSRPGKMNYASAGNGSTHHSVGSCSSPRGR